MRGAPCQLVCQCDRQRWQSRLPELKLLLSGCTRWSSSATEMLPDTAYYFQPFPVEDARFAIAEITQFSDLPPAFGVIFKNTTLATPASPNCFYVNCLLKVTGLCTVIFFLWIEIIFFSRKSPSNLVTVTRVEPIASAIA
jgi:hypothetical protein